MGLLGGFIEFTRYVIHIVKAELETKNGGKVDVSAAAREQRH